MPDCIDQQTACLRALGLFESAQAETVVSGAYFTATTLRLVLLGALAELHLPLPSDPEELWAALARTNPQWAPALREAGVIQSGLGVHYNWAELLYDLGHHPSALRELDQAARYDAVELRGDVAWVRASVAGRTLAPGKVALAVEEPPIGASFDLMHDWKSQRFREDWSADVE